VAGYGSETTTDEVLLGVDLQGRRIVITGTTSGLGEESTRALAAKGASITMAARDPEKMSWERSGMTSPFSSMNRASAGLTAMYPSRSTSGSMVG